MNKINLIGEKFKRLTPVKETRLRNRIAWICVCDCGNTKTVTSDDLKQKKVLSCGCLKKELDKTRKLKHGNSKTKIYNCWIGMIDRCTNPENSRYPSYGGRGIRVCERWMTLENFIEDMSPRPDGKVSIERIDNNKGYYPDNCKWATDSEQQSNKRNSCKYFFDGESLTVAEIARRVGINKGTLNSRLKSGWGLIDATTIPVDKSRRRNVCV